MNPQTTSAPVPVPAPRKPVLRGLIIAVIVIVVLLVAGYGVLAMTASTNGLLSAVAKRSASPNHFDLVIAATSANKSISGSSLTLSADADRSNPSDPAVQATVSLQLPTMSGDAELRMIHKTLYMRLDTVPVAYQPLVQSILGKWYSVSHDALLKMTQTRQLGISSTTFAEAWDGKTDPAQNYAKLIDAGVISGIRFLGIGSHHGDLERLYAVDFNAKAYKDFVMSKMPTTTDSQAAAQANASLDQILSTVSFKSAVVSIGFFNGDLDAMEFDMVISPQTAAFPDSINLHIATSYGPMAAGTVISAPADSTSLDAFLLQAAQQIPKQAAK